jgi:outer membrane protein assembly factor BamB
MFSCVSPSISTVDENEDDYEEKYREYVKDWFVQPGDSKIFMENYNSVAVNEEYQTPISNQAFKSNSGPMNSAWPMQGHDVFHTCRSQYSTENNTGVEIWRVRGDWTGAVESSTVVDNNGIIYFGTMGADGSLYALYPNGTRKWSHMIDGIIWDTPAIADDGTLYFTTWGGSYLYAISTNGTEQWLFNQESSSGSSPTIGTDGIIYFGTMDGYLFAVNPNGTEQWRLYLGGNLISSPAIDTDNIIYIGTTSHYLYAVNPNGTLRWQFGAGQFKGNPSIAEDGTIYAPSFDGYLYALYPNGTMKWRASTGDSVAGAGVALANDGIIYIGTEQLRAFYPNGTLKWCTNIQGSVYGTVPAVCADGTIYVSAGGSLVAVYPDGTEKWRKQLTIAQIKSSPSIGPNDRVYVGSEDYGIGPYGYLHAFGTIESNQPPEKPVINGSANVTIQTEATYIFQASDPDNNPISFYIDWGDGSNEETMDYISGFTTSIIHTWNQQGTYTIRAKTIDTFGLESDWASFTIKAPLSYDRPHFRFLDFLLERLPNAFPFLRFVLKY